MHDRIAAERRKQVQQSGRRYRQRWSPQLKAQLLEYVGSRQRAGTSYARIAEEIGVPFATIADWAQAVRRRRAARLQDVTESGNEVDPLRKLTAAIEVVHWV